MRLRQRLRLRLIRRATEEHLKTGASSRRCQTERVPPTYVPSGVSRLPLRGTLAAMLRKLLWTGLYASLAAAATVAARRTASTIWRVATGEEPPVKK